jgi:PIN domain nuclease of toxin-antitoxin system
MRALLDTHAFLWWAADDARLSSKAREVIKNPDNVLFFSVASAWEIIIKHTINKLPLPEPPQTYIPTRVAYYELQTLSIEISHVLQLTNLPRHHNDPFDRILIAQSQAENLPIITVDEKFALYPVAIIW